MLQMINIDMVELAHPTHLINRKRNLKQAGQREKKMDVASGCYNCTSGWMDWDWV